MSYYVLLDVGCLECNDATTVMGVYADRKTAMAELRESARLSSSDEDHPWPVLTGKKLREELKESSNSLTIRPITTIALAGWGGSYWYPLQLHKIEVTF
jgi:hypothetical protein